MCASVSALPAAYPMHRNIHLNRGQILRQKKLMDDFAGWFLATPSALREPVYNCAKEKNTAIINAILNGAKRNVAMVGLLDRALAKDLVIEQAVT